MDGRDTIHSVAFLMEGKHIVSGGKEEKIRRWRLEDGEEVARPIDVGGWANSIAVSSDEKWMVVGSGRGRVSVWSMENHERVGEMKGHAKGVGAVDISPDGTKIASGSLDNTACIWKWSTGKRLLTLRHDNDVAAVKFSPDGDLLATATWERDSIRVYNGEDGHLLHEFPIKAGSYGHCLAWKNDTHLYAISRDGRIYYLDVSTRETLSRWHIRADDVRKWSCIALPDDRSFIAASANSSISFWDTTTNTKIGSDIDYNDMVFTMAISENYDIAIGHGKTVTVQNLRDILPPNYVRNNVDHGERTTSRTQAEMSDLKKAMQELKDQLTVLQGRHEAQVTRTHLGSERAADFEIIH
ncbi:WD40-repeat-containing domain protein [Chiua virens]|nr:WD40-repeat-containing domain protein [Chiua virens]